MQSRNSREHAAEVEGLRSRIATLETECSDLRVESARVKADSQAVVLVSCLLRPFNSLVGIFRVLGL